MTKFNIPEDLPPPLTVEETAELYGVNDVERNRIISKADAAFNRREAVEGHRKTEAEPARGARLRRRRLMTPCFSSTRRGERDCHQ